MKKLNDAIFVLGGDGYLGWSIALALASRTDSNVIIIDSLFKRKWEADVNVKSLIQLKSPEERIKDYNQLYNRTNLKYEHANLTNYETAYQLIKKYQPKTIINTAQQPSAPFSMMSSENARITFDNNSTTNLNVVWAIAATNPNIKYITLGSAGVYLSIEADFIPQAKVDMNFSVDGNPHQIINTWMPMQASDIYHQSKINSFLLNDLCTNLWGLKTITVQQSTIFGQSIPENQHEKYHDLSTRLNYDHIFGTVLNRFVCQSAIRHPITVYGDGSQTTGVISLSDAIDNFVRLCELPIENGTHHVEHNYTHNMSIQDMVNHLAVIADIEAQYLENPRFEPKSTLSKKMESSSAFKNKLNNEISFIKELKSLYNFVSIHKNNINRSYILPSVNWKISKERSKAS